MKQIEGYIWVRLKLYQCEHWCCIFAISFEILGSVEGRAQRKSLWTSSLLRRLDLIIESAEYRNFVHT
jgi:hypothetical protein